MIKGMLTTSCIKSVHDKIKDVHCQLCDYSTSAKETLQQHMNTHINVKKFPCTECSKLFSSQRYVKRHEERVHSGDKKEIWCMLCSKAFGTRVDLVMHIKRKVCQKKKIKKK